MVADLPGITEKVTALHAIESDDVADHHFDVLGDDWDIETRADEALRHIRLTKADPPEPHHHLDSRSSGSPHRITTASTLTWCL